MLTLAYGGDCSVELRLVALRLGRGLDGKGYPCVVEVREGLKQNEVQLIRDDEQRLMIRGSESDPWSLELETSVSRRRMPFPGPYGSPGLRSPFLMLFTCDEHGRRLRMVLRTLTELRRRGTRMKSAAFGALAPEVLSQGFTSDACFPRLDAVELENLLRHTAVLLECADDSGVRTVAGALAESSGIPTVVHVEALAGQRFDSAMCVDEWSADAFASVILETQSRTRTEARPEVLLSAIIEELRA